MYACLQVALFFFSFIFISWRLITLQYCSGFCHTLTWVSHGVTCIPHPDPPSHLPLYPIPLGLPSAPGPSTCLMHPTWAGDLFHLQVALVLKVFSFYILLFPLTTSSFSLSPCLQWSAQWLTHSDHLVLVQEMKWQLVKESAMSRS